MAMQPMTIADHFQLGRVQAELDFVDVPVNSDIPLFVDPFALSVLPDPWSVDCSARLQGFFQAVVDAIRTGNMRRASDLLLHLQEPNETRLGLSRGRSRGAGIGRGQAEDLFDALSSSTAVKTGFITHLEETELMIRGIGRDKISDITTNVIRRQLAEYTIEQCRLHGIPTQRCPLPPALDDNQQWVSAYHNLPVTPRGPLLLVPKTIVRYDASYDHRTFYRNFVLEYLRAEALSGGSSLVRKLKNGTQRVFIKDLEARFPLTKEFLFEFSKEHPEVLKEYREALSRLERQKHQALGSGPDTRMAAKALARILPGILAGSEQAALYHRFMVGALELLFFPDLVHPRKEQEIHEGRKRIDILVENGARPGTAVFNLANLKRMSCAYVPVECKNYTTEVANPELDQLSGRFSDQRGRFGILCCRRFENRQLFIERCRDTLRDGRGLIVPLDDETVLRLLDAISEDRRSEVDVRLGELMNEVYLG